MPRRVLILLTLIVTAMHWLVLGGMRPGAHSSPADPAPAFHTRMVALPAPAPEPPPEPEMPLVPESAPAAPPETPAPVPAPKPKPRPKARTAPPKAPPAPAPAPPAEEDSAPVIGPIVKDPPEMDTPSEDAEGALPILREPFRNPEASADTLSPAAAEGEGEGEGVRTEAATLASAASAPAAPASSPVTDASAPAAPPEARNNLSAAVEITPPGATTGSPPKDQAPPVRMPATTTLEYEVVGEVKKFKYNVNGELAWKNNGDHYEVRQEIRAFLIGSRSQTSTGRITDAGLAPSRFGDKGKRELAAHFNFDQHEVIFSANTPTLSISAGAQDRVSVLIQLGALMAASPQNYPSGTRITFTTVGPRTADRWTFTVGAAEMLDLPAGPTPAIRLEKLPSHDRDLRADLWLGTDKQFLPVRLKLTQSNGDFADLRLK